VYWFAPVPPPPGRAIVKAATVERPAPRYVVPARSRLLVAAFAAMPTRAADATKRRIMSLPGHADTPR
jgi:hypothetical protein